jgi:hypothetical protein
VQSLTPFPPQIQWRPKLRRKLEQLRRLCTAVSAVEKSRHAIFSAASRILFGRLDETYNCTNHQEGGKPMEAKPEKTCPEQSVTAFDRAYLSKHDEDKKTSGCDESGPLSSAPMARAPAIDAFCSGQEDHQKRQAKEVNTG